MEPVSSVTGCGSRTPTAWTWPAWCSWGRSSRHGVLHRQRSRPARGRPLQWRAASLILATARDPRARLGDVDAVDTPRSWIDCWPRISFPVVSTIGADEAGQAYDVNADSVAGAGAGAWQPEKIIYLTDVEGLPRDVDDPRRFSVKPHRRGGSCTYSDRQWRRRRHDPEDGRVRACGQQPRRAPHTYSTAASPHVLLLELFTDEGIGTMILGAMFVSSHLMPTYPPQP